MKSSSISSFFLVFIFLFLTWPLFGAWLTIFARTWIWMPLGVVICFLTNPKAFRSKSILALLIYSLIVVMNYMFGDSYYHDAIKIIIEFLTFLLLCSCFYLISHDYGEKEKRHFINIMLFFVFFTGIASIIINIPFPNAIRINASALFTDTYSPYIYLERYGLSDYNIPHAIPVLIPAIVLRIRQNIHNRIVFVFYFILLFVCVSLTYISGATTPFLLALLITILSLIISTNGYRGNIIKMVILIVLLGLLYNDELMIGIIHDLNSIVDNPSINERLIDIEESLLYGESEGEVGSRSELYMKSINAFSSSFFWGVNSNVGGHSALLDRLGTLGLLGFIPFILFICIQLKSTILTIPKNYRFYYYVSILSAFFMLGSKNMSNWPMWCFLFIISPLMIGSTREKRKIKR